MQIYLTLVRVNVGRFRKFPFYVYAHKSIYVCVKRARVCALRTLVRVYT